MQTLYSDITKKIGETLTDKEKIRLTMTSKKMDHLKHEFIYEEKISTCKIENLSYFDKFENVEIFDATLKYPKYMKYAHYVALIAEPPKFITHLVFDDRICGSVYKIPQSVTHLTFGARYRQPIKEKVLRSSITYLDFGHMFNQPIKEGILPQSLIYLIFVAKFNQPINNGVLPQSIINLTFGIDFNQPIDNIPSSITNLTLGMTYNRTTRFDILPSITHLTLYTWPQYNNMFLSSSIKYLVIRDVCWLKYNSLLPTVTHLSLDCCSDRMFYHIPPFITHLTFGDGFTLSIEGQIPQSVTHLSLGRNFKQTINGCIPSSVKEIRINKKYNKTIDEEITLRTTIIRT